LPLTSSDLAAAAVAENREEMDSAVKQLVAGLGEAAKVLNNARAPFQLKRDAMKRALGHVWAFFRKFADFEEAGLDEPLEMLLIALLDLERGTQPELLKPRRAGHAPPMSYAKQTLALRAAVALNEQMRLGLDRDAGAEVVARQITLAGIRLPNGKPVTDKLVISWRKQLQASSGAMAGSWLRVRKPSAPDLRPGLPVARIMLRHFRQRMERLAVNLKR
jgi:hypothetical protein